MKRKKFFYPAVSLFTVISLGSLFILPTVLAADKVTQQGRDLSVDDWVAHLSLLIAVTIFVIVVDAVVIGLIMKKRKQAKQGVENV